MTKTNRKPRGRSNAPIKPRGELLSRMEACMVKKLLGCQTTDLLDADEIVRWSVPVSDLPSPPQGTGRRRYQLEVSFPLDFGTFVEQTAEVCRLVGEGSSSSGAGFGRRELLFEDKTKAWCKAAAERVRVVKPDYEVRVSEMAW